MPARSNSKFAQRSRSLDLAAVGKAERHAFGAGTSRVRESTRPNSLRAREQLKIADATQLFGNLLHYRLRQSAEQAKQPSAIDRARLIDHHLADASVAGYFCWQLDAQDVLAGEAGGTVKDPRARMIRLVQQIRLDHDYRPNLSRFASASRIQV